jgi:hypothetical protein
MVKDQPVLHLLPKLVLRDPRSPRDHESGRHLQAQEDPGRFKDSPALHLPSHLSLPASPGPNLTCLTGNSSRQIRLPTSRVSASTLRQLTGTSPTPRPSMTGFTST